MILFRCALFVNVGIGAEKILLPQLPQAQFIGEKGNPLVLPELQDLTCFVLVPFGEKL